MKNTNTTNIRLLVGAGLGVGIVDPFTPTRLCAARQHPRRDPEVHPNGGGGTTPPNPATPPAPGETPPAPGVTPPAPASTPPAQDDWATLFEGQTPAQVKKALDESSRWENRSKANFEKATKYDDLLKALNGDGGSTPPDPAKLTTDLSAAQKDARETKIENAVLRLAGRHSASGDQLIDSRSFMASVKDLDPTAEGFAAQVEAAIKGAVDANAALKIQAPGVGAHVPGEGQSPATPPSLSAQIAAAQAEGDTTRAMALKSQQLAELSRQL